MGMLCVCCPCYQCILTCCTGAIFGLAGALLVYFVRNRPFFNTDKADNIIKRLVLTIVINLVVGLALPNIDEWCASARAA